MELENVSEIVEIGGEGLTVHVLKVLAVGGSSSRHFGGRTVWVLGPCGNIID